jgi:hypothetical protein
MHVVRFLKLTGDFSSIVLEHLETFFKNDHNVAITCIFCNYKLQADQTVPNLIASLLKQIVQGSHTDLKEVKSLYTRHKKDCTRPTLNELTSVLALEIGALSKVFIVVDALDECREDDASRAKLLKVLRLLPKNVNLMVTSRNLPTIAEDFDKAERLDIRATGEDVTTYVNSRISLAPRHIKDLQEIIVSKVVGSADGM